MSNDTPLLIAAGRDHDGNAWIRSYVSTDTYAADIEQAAIVITADWSQRETLTQWIDLVDPSLASHLDALINLHQ